MKQFIQNLPVLNASELKIINNYIDSLDFVPNTVFDTNGTAREDSSLRTSTGTFLEEHVAATVLLHEKIIDIFIQLSLNSPKHMQHITHSVSACLSRTLHPIGVELVHCGAHVFPSI